MQSLTPADPRARIRASGGVTECVKTPKVAVVVLTYNGKAVAERCLRSVFNSSYANMHVIVVDNASSDGSLAFLCSEFPLARGIANEKNLGVAAGRNRGFKEAARLGVDYILSLDNDTRIDKELITELVRMCESDPSIGIVGPKSYMDDGSDRIQCAGGKITYTQNVCSERGRGSRERGQYEKIEEVDYFPGFGFMARREVFEHLNFLDETFSGYGHEDTDFCMRARLLGYRVVYVPRAKLWHRGSATIGQYTPRKKYLEAVNSVYFVRKYASRQDRLKYAFFALSGLIYAMVAQSTKGNLPAVIAKARGLRDGLRKMR